MRGALIASQWENTGIGIIPAYAGSTLSGDQLGAARRDHPRVCGEHTKKSLQSQQYDRQDL